MKEDSWERGNRLRTIIFQKIMTDFELDKLRESPWRKWD